MIQFYLPEETFILFHPDYILIKGCPDRILAAIDEYRREKAFLINIGTKKDVLRKVGGQKYISLEVSSIFASVSAALIDLAGLDDNIKIIVGPYRDSLRALSKTYPGCSLDMFFFDYAKIKYTNDLKLCEELGLVSQDTTIIADNVSRNSEYLEYVRAPGLKKRMAADETKRLTLCYESDIFLGRFDLRYKTSVVYSIKPTGEPVSIYTSSSPVSANRFTECSGYFILLGK
ncbi:uncharacterized protein BO66DRAFT_407309 [Aspergillus aculeatinus CBS 121060]|uniref:Uncharacterized protein n=1 Tax=Aspergillus aculeatinus CBS 121060 TaxID=1448322 RepID=A0ACD1HPN9_9EURO|nr:hypothetical protein BO66DRAFT_407309 [Aspergillus aculeatinus CBS 121060]RAH75501.1 hypothetical protein BO66DRAFT_407309 [Aspergillus aculeatinus CBS 121060]